jgi:flagellar hook-basal body complex protein FliE
MNILSTKGVEFSGGQPRVQTAFRANALEMKTAHADHMVPGRVAPEPESFAGGFAAALMEALNGVEKIDKQSMDLSTRAVYDPDSVEAHEVMISAEKARFALNLTKTVADGVVRTFKELTAPK